MRAPFQLHSTESGAPAGEAVVFLHGFMGRAADWEPIVSGLSPHRRYLCVDLPGHGRSLGGPDEAYAMAGAAAQVIEDAVDAHGIATFSLVGYSMGARLALYMAAHFSMRIDRLCVESGTAGLRTEAERTERRQRDEALAERLTQGDFSVFLREWYAQPLFATLERDAARREALLAHRLDNDPAELARALRGMGTGAMPSLWDGWEENEIPTLLVAGGEDFAYVTLAQELAARCARARLQVVPGCGHNVHWEDPAAYTRALDLFLG